MLMVQWLLPRRANAKCVDDRSSLLLSQCPHREVADAFVNAAGNIYMRFPTYGKFNGIDGGRMRVPRPYQEPK